MAEKRVERRLAAILAADVAGYSRLTGADEEGTVSRLRALRQELIDPLVDAHGGRIVKHTGDGRLIEFASVVDAVRCASAVQSGMTARNANVVPDKRIEFRVGIHLGDVMVESDGDLMGDGVNIAARLEGIAEPGGICLSEDAWRQVRDKIDASFSDIGEQSLKNISRPVRVYRMTVGGALSPAPPDDASAPRLSMVVLPFANLGGDPAQDFLADVLTEELTTYLSRIPDAFIIARSTAFTFKGKAIDVKRLGQELGVRYALEGSTQPSGGRVRVNAQLIDTESGAHVWADRFDAARGELLDMQEEIVIRIARTLQVKLSEVDAARVKRVKVENPDAEALAIRAEALFLAYGISEREETKTFQRLCEEALEQDPRNLRALSILALVLGVGIWAGRLDQDRDGRRADDLIERALSIDPNQYLAHHARAFLLMLRGNHEEAIAADERALDMNPIYVGTYITLSLCQLALGRPEAGLAYIEKAMRLSPRDPLTWSLQFNKGVLHMMQGDNDRAMEALSRAIALNPANYYGRAHLAAALALMGRIDEAREQLQRHLATRGMKTIVAWKAREDSGNPAFLAHRERLYEGLRKAGMPEA